MAVRTTTPSPTDSAVQPVQVGGSPADLDLRRQLREAREELRARREQEQALREHLEALGNDLGAAQHLYAELRVRHMELLAHARATVAAAARGELAPGRYIAGHLEEIGLQPAPDAVPDRLIAEALAVVERLSGQRDGGDLR